MKGGDKIIAPYEPKRETDLMNPQGEHRITNTYAL